MIERTESGTMCRMERRARTRARIPVEEISTLVTGQCRQGTPSPRPLAASPARSMTATVAKRPNPDPLELVPALELPPLIHPHQEHESRCRVSTAELGQGVGRVRRSGAAHLEIAGLEQRIVRHGGLEHRPTNGGRRHVGVATMRRAGRQHEQHAVEREFVDRVAGDDQVSEVWRIERSPEDAELRGTHRTPPEGTARADALLPSPRASSELG